MNFSELIRALRIDLAGDRIIMRLLENAFQQLNRYANGYANIRKNYFMIGYNENGNPFAHPISAHMVHAAIKKDDSVDYVVRAARAWIWGIKPEQLGTILRNGDVAMIPVKSVPKKNVEIRTGMEKIIDSHYIYSREIRFNGKKIYAYNPTLRHMKRQHPTQKGIGWYKIMVGNRADYHEFARPTAD